MTKIRKLLKSDSGATAIEYGLIVALISLAIVVGAMMAGNGLNDMFTAVGSTVSSAGSSVN